MGQEIEELLLVNSEHTCVLIADRRYHPVLIIKQRPGAESFPGVSGHYFPAAAVQQGNVSVVADHVGFAEAAMAEPLSCVYSAFERNDMQIGDVVLVIGAGPIGLMHAKLYLMAGAGAVIVNDINNERLEQCKQIEPRIQTVGPEDLRDLCDQESKGRGVDIVVTAAPRAVPPALLEQLAPGGRLVIPVGSYDQELQVHRRTEHGIEVERVFPVRFVPMTGEARGDPPRSHE